MAKPKPNLSGVSLDDMTPPQVAAGLNAVPQPRKARRPKREEPTTLVGGQLAIRYGRSLNMLSAETGKTNRQLLEEALDGLFVKYGAKVLDV